MKNLLACILLLLPLASQASFSSSKAELLYGSGYERPDADQVTLTLTNASGWRWGDSFFFMDAINIDAGSDWGGVYAEWGPRVSLLRTLGNGANESGFLKDLYIIGQTDITANSNVSKVVLMGGLSVDLNVPGFRLFKTNVQYRDDPDLKGRSMQFTLAWNAPFTIRGQRFSFEGFLDYITEEDVSVANLLTQPQLMWHRNDQLGIGVEYLYWRNRLGIDGLTESVAQAMVRWTF